MQVAYVSNVNNETKVPTYSAVTHPEIKLTKAETVAPVVPTSIDGKDGEFTLPAGQDFKLTLAANGIKDEKGTQLVAIGKDAGGADYKLPTITADNFDKSTLTDAQKTALEDAVKEAAEKYVTDNSATLLNTYKDVDAVKIAEADDMDAQLKEWMFDYIKTNAATFLDDDHNILNDGVGDKTYIGIQSSPDWDSKKEALVEGYAAKFESDPTAKAEMDAQTASINATAKLEVLKADAALATPVIMAENAGLATAKTTAETAYINENFTGTDGSAIKWVVEEVTVKNGVTTRKASGNAKFSGKATATGTEVTINKTKAAGKFNSTIIIKAVGKNYDTKKANAADYKTEETKTDGKVTSDTRIFAEFKLYVTPAVPTEWKEVKNLDKLGMTEVKDVEEGYDQEYNMKLAEGKSAKLLFAPKDGGDKTMVYEIQAGAMGFQVVNGAVKALAGGGSGGIVCYPTASPDKKILVHVTTESAIKSIRANTTKVTVYPGSTQTIYLGTVPASFDTTYDVGGNASGTVDGVCTWTIVGNKLTITAANGVAKGAKGTLEVKTGSVKPLKITLTGADAPLNAKALKLSTKKTNADGLIEVNVPVGTAYNLGIAMNPATADANMEVNKGTKYSGGAISGEIGKVDVPVIQKAEDTPTNPPAENPETPEQPSSEENTAEGNSASAPIVGGDGDGTNETQTGGGSGEGSGGSENNQTSSDNEGGSGGTTSTTPTTEKKDALEVSGDVIKGNGVGTYYIQYTSEAAGADGNVLTTPVYKINVYTPGSTIVMNQKSNKVLNGLGSDVKNYSVVGGILMSTEEANTSCTKTLVGGTTYQFPAPTTAGSVSEDIVWTCNKPAAVGIEVNNGVMSLTPYQAGTFTVTGTTKYTKQKMSFKVQVVADNDAIAAAEASNYTIQYQDTDGTWKALDTSATFATKQKVNVRVATSTGAVGAVKFTGDTNGAANAGGVYTAKTASDAAKLGAEVTLTKADKTKSTITVAPVTFKITAPTATFTKVSVPVGVVKGTEAKFAAAVKNVKPAEAKVEWTATNKSGGTAHKLGETLNGKFKVDLEPGDYTVVCKVNDEISNSFDMTVYASDQAIKSATTNYTFAEYSDELATAADVDKAEAVADDAAKTKKNQTAALKAINNAYKTAINNLKGKKEGQGAAYGTYYIPIFATPVTDGSTLTKAGVDDIVWTSSNVNLANATTVEKNTVITDGLQAGLINQAANAAYAIAKITTTTAETGYTGQVILTGLLKNSGKKITITLNLNGGSASEDSQDGGLVDVTRIDTDDTLATLTSVQSITSASDGAPAFDDIPSTIYEEVGADESKKSHIKDDYLNKEFTYQEYVLVKSKDDLVDEPSTEPITISKYITLDTNKFTVSGNNVTVKSALEDGTYYLAVLETVVTTPKENPAVTEDAAISATQTLKLASNTGFKLETVNSIAVTVVGQTGKTADADAVVVNYTKWGADNGGWKEGNGALSFVESKSNLAVDYTALSVQGADVGGGNLKIWFNGDANVTQTTTKILYLVEKVGDDYKLVTEKPFKVTITVPSQT